MAEKKEPKFHVARDPKRNLKRNEFINSLYVVEFIKNADFHNIMLDEISDASNKEQAIF